MIKTMRIDPDRLLWICRQCLVRLGWQAMLGGALLIASGLIAMLWLRPMWKESREIQAQSKTLQVTAVQRRAIARQADPVAQLAEFYKLFPDTDSIADTLERIYVAAAENNLTLTQGDYSLTPAEGRGLRRYETSLPLHGKYAQVRNFVAKVLTENKNVALAGINFSRNTAAEINIDAQVRFIVYVKDAS